RADHSGVDLISDVLPFSPLWYAGPNAISNAIRYAKSSSRSHDAVIRVFDGAGNVIETHEQAGDLLKPRTFASASPATPSSVPAKSASADIATTAPALGGGHDLVRVNTEKHVYHREDSRFYGTTKKGKNMTEREAIQTGNKAARLGRVAAQSNAIGDRKSTRLNSSHVSMSYAVFCLKKKEKKKQKKNHKINKQKKRAHKSCKTRK